MLGRSRTTSRAPHHKSPNPTCCTRCPRTIREKTPLLRPHSAFSTAVSHVSQHHLSKLLRLPRLTRNLHTQPQRHNSTSSQSHQPPKSHTLSPFSRLKQKSQPIVVSWSEESDRDRNDLQSIHNHRPMPSFPFPSLPSSIPPPSQHNTLHGVFVREPDDAHTATNTPGLFSSRPSSTHSIDSFNVFPEHPTLDLPITASPVAHPTRAVKVNLTGPSRDLPPQSPQLSSSQHLRSTPATKFTPHQLQQAQSKSKPISAASSKPQFSLSTIESTGDIHTLTNFSLDFDKFENSPQSQSQLRSTYFSKLTAHGLSHAPVTIHSSTLPATSHLVRNVHDPTKINQISFQSDNDFQSQYNHQHNCQQIQPNTDIPPKQQDSFFSKDDPFFDQFDSSPDPADPVNTDEAQSDIEMQLLEQETSSHPNHPKTTPTQSASLHSQPAQPHTSLHDSIPIQPDHPAQQTTSLSPPPRPRSILTPQPPSTPISLFNGLDTKQLSTERVCSGQQSSKFIAPSYDNHNPFLTQDLPISPSTLHSKPSLSPFKSLQQHTQSHRPTQPTQDQSPSAFSSPPLASSSGQQLPSESTTPSTRPTTLNLATQPASSPSPQQTHHNFSSPDLGLFSADIPGHDPHAQQDIETEQQFDQLLQFLTTASTPPLQSHHPIDQPTSRAENKMSINQENAHHTPSHSVSPRSDATAVHNTTLESLFAKSKSESAHNPARSPDHNFDEDELLSSSQLVFNFSKRNSDAVGADVQSEVLYEEYQDEIISNYDSIGADFNPKPVPQINPLSPAKPIEDNEDDAIPVAPYSTKQRHSPQFANNSIQFTWPDSTPSSRRIVNYNRSTRNTSHKINAEFESLFIAQQSKPKSKSTSLHQDKNLIKKTTARSHAQTRPSSPQKQLKLATTQEIASKQDQTIEKLTTKQITQKTQNAQNRLTRIARASTFSTRYKLSLLNTTWSRLSEERRTGGVNGGILPFYEPGLVYSSTNHPSGTFTIKHPLNKATGYVQQDYFQRLLYPTRSTGRRIWGRFGNHGNDKISVKTSTPLDKVKDRSPTSSTKKLSVHHPSKPPKPQHTSSLHHLDPEIPQILDFPIVAGKRNKKFLLQSYLASLPIPALQLPESFRDTIKQPDVFQDEPNKIDLDEFAPFEQFEISTDAESAPKLPIPLASAKDLVKHPLIEMGRRLKENARSWKNTRSAVVNLCITFHPSPTHLQHINLARPDQSATTLDDLKPFQLIIPKIDVSTPFHQLIQKQIPQHLEQLLQKRKQSSSPRQITASSQTNQVTRNNLTNIDKQLRHILQTPPKWVSAYHLSSKWLELHDNERPCLHPIAMDQHNPLQLHPINLKQTVSNQIFNKFKIHNPPLFAYNTINDVTIGKQHPYNVELQLKW